MNGTLLSFKTCFFNCFKISKIKKLINLVPSPSPGAQGEVLGTRLEVNRTNKRQRSKRIRLICRYVDSVGVSIYNELSYCNCEIVL